MMLTSISLLVDSTQPDFGPLKGIYLPQVSDLYLKDRETALPKYDSNHFSLTPILGHDEPSPSAAYLPLMKEIK